MPTRQKRISLIEMSNKELGNLKGGDDLATTNPSCRRICGSVTSSAGANLIANFLAPEPAPSDSTKK